MSHVVSVDIQLKDLNAVVRACERMGWEFCEGQETFEWYGRWVNDYDGEDAAYKLGIKPEDYGKCTHAIKVPGAQYEIGLIQQADGSYAPVWDYWGPGGLDKLREENGMDGFMQLYGVEAAKNQLTANGVFGITEHTNEKGHIVLSGTTN